MEPLDDGRRRRWTSSSALYHQFSEPGKTSSTNLSTGSKTKSQSNKPVPVSRSTSRNWMSISTSTSSMNSSRTPNSQMPEKRSNSSRKVRTIRSSTSSIAMLQEPYWQPTNATSTKSFSSDDFRKSEGTK